MNPFSRWAAVLSCLAALLFSACDPKEKYQGEDGDRGGQGEPGVAGPAGPQGPPGSADAWSRAGNAGTVDGTDFLGTTDNVPFEIRVNSNRVARVEAEFDPPGGSLAEGANVIVGSRLNTVTSGAVGCTVMGGGTIDIGFAVARGNTASDDFATVGGGWNNVAGTADADTRNGMCSTVTGGRENSATGGYSTVGGGYGNDSTGLGSLVSGGEANSATGSRSAVCGGSGATCSGDDSFIGGGYLNVASGSTSVIAGGGANTASGAGSVVGGGNNNLASSANSIVGGGSFNKASGPLAAILGGTLNVACGEGSIIPGGVENETRGICALAAGRRALTRFDGSFVWADLASAAGVHGDPFRGDARANQFNAFASGGVRFVTRYDGEGLPVAAVELAPGGSSWLSLLDKASVASVRRADSREVLSRLRTLPISTWSFAAQDASVRHLGPLAEDFRAAFGLGESDRHIGHIDANGVALAAIQGLALELDARDARIAAMEREGQEREGRTLEILAVKEARIAALEEGSSESARKIADLEARLARLERILDPAGSR